VVETIDESSRRQGRAVLADFHTEAGEIGVPAAARGIISVGAVDLKSQPQSYSAVGTPMLAELETLPLLRTYDAVELAGGGAIGGSVAAAYAAGATASMLTAGQSQSEVARWLASQQGNVLRVAPVRR
jgi:hypothetical protein